MIIGLIGHQGVGKTYLAERLIKRHPTYTHLTFAQPIIDATLALNPIVDLEHGYRFVDLYHKHGWDEAKRIYPEMRELVKRMGKEVGRDQIDPDIWVAKVHEKVRFKQSISPHRAPIDTPALTNVVFSDCRMQNEVDYVRGLGGFIWRVERDGGFVAPDYSTPLYQHGTEADWRTVVPDLVFNNPGSEYSHERVDMRVHMAFDCCQVMDLTYRGVVLPACVAKGDETDGCKTVGVEYFRKMMGPVWVSKNQELFNEMTAEEACDQYVPPAETAYDDAAMDAMMMAMLG